MPRDIEHFNEKTNQLKQQHRTERHLLFDKIETAINTAEQFTKEQTKNIDLMSKSNDQMKAEVKVFQFVQNLFKFNKEIDPEADLNQDEAAAHLLGNQNEEHMEHPAGVILESEADRLRRLVFRITKGKG